MIDAHLHVWDPAEIDHGWLRPGLGDLYGRFDVTTARAAAEAAARVTGVPVEGVVLVQAADHAAETAWMERQAETSDGWVRGVVGWLPLREPREVETLLDGPRGLRVGVRHLFHDDPDPDMLADPRVRSSLRAVARAGLPLDVPDAWPAGLLPHVVDLARDQPDLVVVLDHLGKPPVGGDLRSWSELVRELARNPSAVAKVSGLATSLVPGARWSTATVRPVWDVALEAFGPDRLLLGSDYPIAQPAGDYVGAVGPLLTLVGELSPDERTAVLSGTAHRVYGV